jgi:hypothetical protein
MRFASAHRHSTRRAQYHCAGWAGCYAEANSTGAALRHRPTGAIRLHPNVLIKEAVDRRPRGSPRSPASKSGAISLRRMGRMLRRSQFYRGRVQAPRTGARRLHPAVLVKRRWTVGDAVRSAHRHPTWGAISLRRMGPIVASKPIPNPPVFRRSSFSAGLRSLLAVSTGRC